MSGHWQRVEKVRSSDMDGDEAKWLSSDKTG
jgi:hypothetical protein